MLLYRDLTDAERLLVTALRRTSPHGAVPDALAEDVAELLGVFEAAASLPLLIELTTLLVWRGRRRLRAGGSGEMALTADEVLVLQIVAAGQAGRPDLLAALLIWLAPPDARPQFADLVARLSNRWASRGHHVILRRPALSEERCSGPGARRVGAAG